MWYSKALVSSAHIVMQEGGSYPGGTLRRKEEPEAEVSSELFLGTERRYVSTGHRVAISAGGYPNVYRRTVVVKVREASPSSTKIPPTDLTSFPPVVVFRCGYK